MKRKSELILALGRRASSVAAGYLHLDSALAIGTDRVAGVIADALGGKPAAEIVQQRLDVK